MADLGAHLSQRGTLVDTNNDGIADGFAHTVKNAGNFSTFSLTNGILSLAPSSSGASIGGADTQVQFNDAGSLNGESTFTYNKTSNTLTIANVVISGDLTVSGTTTTVNTATLDIADNIITLNSDLGSGVAPSQNAGILINRGSATDVEFVWDETNDRWDFDGYTLASVGKVQASGSGAVYTFGSDTDTGIEHTGTNQLGLLVNNTRVLMVSANGVHIAPAGATGAGSNQALLVDNIAIDTNTISSSDTNGNIVLAPNGTGDVQVDADTLRVGDSGSDATITTNGAGDLTISTNGGTNSGYVKVEDGANNDILIIPNGTGKVGIGQLTPTEILHVDGNAIITGTLTVQGATTTVSTTNTFVSDSVMTLNSGETANGVSGNVAGFEVDRGENSGVDNALARFVFDDSDDKFKVQMETGSGTGSYNAAGLVASTIEGTTGTFSGDVAVDTDTLFVDVSTDRVGINVASPTEALDVTGTIKASADIEIGGNGDVSGRLNANLTMKIQNETGSTLSKGSPVYISATHSSGRPQVALTDADESTNKYPAIGLVFEDVSTGSQGYALTSGIVEDVPASFFVGTDPSAGDTVYISATEGKLTVDRSTGDTVKVQNIGRITKTNVNVSANSGTAHILVQGPGRVNDVPNEIVSISDDDGDTKIQVEESADEDIIRFDTAGTERMTIGATGTVSMAGDLEVQGVQYQQFKDLTGDLATGYHTIALIAGRSGGSGSGTGGATDQRGIGTFLIRNTDSSRHQTIMLTASHLFGGGNANGISVEHSSYFSTLGISAFRIKEASTYDGAVLQMNIADATNDIEVYLKNNFQEEGWQLITPVADATDPSTGSLGLGYNNTYSDFAATATTSISDIAQMGQHIQGPLVCKNDLTVDTNTLVVDATNNRVGVGTASPATALQVEGGATFNDDGASVDFRVEGDTDTHLLFVDGSADKVRISTSSPVATLDVDSGKSFRATRLLTVSLSANTTLTESGHAGRYIFVTGSSRTITLPATHATGVHFTLLSNDANGFTLASSDNMNGSSSDITVDGRNGVTCISDGSNWVVLGA